MTDGPAGPGAGTPPTGSRDGGQAADNPGTPVTAGGGGAGSEVVGVGRGRAELRRQRRRQRRALVAALLAVAALATLLVTLYFALRSPPAPTPAGEGPRAQRVLLSATGAGTSLVDPRVRSPAPG